MDITEYLLNSGFYIKIEEQETSDSMVVTFPETKIFENKFPKTVHTYSITTSGVNIHNGHVNKEIVCEDYVKRLVIWADVLYNSTKRDFSPEIVLIFRKDGSKNSGSQFLELLSEPQNKRREAKLASIFLMHLSDKNIAYAKAKELGVSQSYKLLSSILLGEI
jgi:hypothetical protein